MDQQHPYPHFKAALLKLAPTNRERADKLGVSTRTIAYYLSGAILPPVEKVKQYPDLDDALSRDIRSETAHIPA